MKSPKATHTCTTCPSVPANAFCSRCIDLLGHIEKVACTAIYRRTTRLFVEGQEPQGVFVLCTGKAKLFTCSAEGKNIITRISEPGDLLGLNAAVSGRAYSVTAEMMTTGQAMFIPRHPLLQLVKDHNQLALAVAEQLSRSYYPLHDVVRALGLAGHPVERLAKLLLSWTSGDNEDVDGSGARSFELPLTHQEIAERIGSTRETVSKLFSDLRRKRLLQSNGPALFIMNRLELEKIVQF